MQPNVIIDLSSHYGIISIIGPDAERFLQGLLTCDVRNLPLVQKNNIYPQYLTALCNIKGRILALMRILRFEKGYWLQLPRNLLPTIQKTLEKYAKFSKVTLLDISSDWGRMGIIGKQLSIKTSDFPDNSVLINFTLEQNQKTLPNLQLADHSRYEIIIPQKDFEITYNSLQSQYQPATFNEWLLHDIRAKLPEVWIETQAQFLPHPLQLPELNAVSFTKGCYCGQEIIARMQYLGNIKRTLHHFEDFTHKNLLIPGSEYCKAIVVTSAFNEQGNIEILLEGAL